MQCPHTSFHSHISPSPILSVSSFIFPLLLLHSHYCLSSLVLFLSSHLLTYVLNLLLCHFSISSSLTCPLQLFFILNSLLHSLILFFPVSLSPILLLISLSLSSHLLSPCFPFFSSPSPSSILLPLLFILFYSSLLLFTYLCPIFSSSVLSSHPNFLLSFLLDLLPVLIFILFLLFYSLFGFCTLP